MRRSSAPTLQDVAREVGVSAMTVSVVLNGARSATRVSDATRTRIQEAAARLRYRPNAAARGLQRRRMDTIGVAAVIDGGELNLYFLELLNGILATAAARGQNATVFSVSHNWERDETRILQLCDGRVDGLILIGALLSPTFADSLLQHTPFVTIHSDKSLSGAWNLEVEDENGAYVAVQHLIAQGHRRILHLAGPLALTGARNRLKGYQRALEEAGIPFDEGLVIESGFSRWGGRNATADLLDRRLLDPLPTAIFCASDAIAVGCMEVLADRGFRVPEDCSVIGFDDTLEARMTSPRLTTVRQPFRQLGHRAVELLLAQIDTRLSPSPEEGTNVPDAMRPDTEVHAVELVVRGTVCPPTLFTSQSQYP